MAFEPNNLRPIARNSTTGDIVWFYQSDDTLDVITAAGYFKSTNTGLSFDDLILVSAADGAANLVVFSVAVNGDIGTLGGQLTAADIAVDESLLPFIGGTVVATNVQEALRRIHQRLNLKVQNIASIGVGGQTLFAGIDDTEDSNRKFNLRRIKAGTGISVALDPGGSILISTTGGGGGDPGNPGTPGSADGGDGTDPAFDTGLRRLHVAPGGQAPLDGTTPNATFTTIQAAINAAIAGDVITVRSGVYRENLTINNKAGTEAAPIWLVAEIRGGVRLARTVANADNGTTWTSEGDGVFSLALANRPYMGAHVRADGTSDFLFPYLNEADLRATTITRFNTTTGGNTTATKPRWGMAFQNGRVFVRLRGDQNPTGESIRLTNGFAGIQIDVNNSDFFILDGFIVEGAGDVRAIDVDTNSASFTIRNVILRLCRHGMAIPSGALGDTCTYEQQGFDLWYEELVRLSGRSINQCFMLFKGYYTAAAVTAANASGGGNATPGGGGGNALGEGSMEFGASYGSVQSNIIWDNCLYGPAFEGSRLGEFNSSRIRNSVFFRCRDDGVQIEAFQNFPAANDRVHDCRFIDCFVDTSHQSDTIDGDAFVFRNVFEQTNDVYSLPGRFSLKMISTPPAARIFYYHNLWIVKVNNATQQIWYPFSNGTAREIERFFNNIVIFEGSLGTPTTRPLVTTNNVVVAPTAGGAAFLTGGGLYVSADDADMRLNADFSLQANSPARNRGQALPAGLPDSRTGAGANADCGPFPFGEVPGDDWPRPRTIIFNLNKPSRWPFA